VPNTRDQGKKGTLLKEIVAAFIAELSPIFQISQRLNLLAYSYPVGSKVKPLSFAGLYTIFYISQNYNSIISSTKSNTNTKIFH